MSSLQAIPSPEERLKRLEKAGTDLKLDKKIPIRRYYKSGAEIFRQANNYYDDESLENAYLLYHKYLSLFIEKVDKHPEFPTVPKEDKVRVKSTLLKVLKRCEEIKARLKEIYRGEYQTYLQELEIQRQKEEELARRLEAQRLSEEDDRLRQETDDFRRALECSAAEARERELAIWHQAQLNEAKARDEFKHRRDHPPNTDFAAPSAPPDNDPGPPPSYDRAVKPANHPSGQARPTVPDRSSKPSSLSTSGLGDLSLLGGGGGLRPLVIPETLMPSFLSIAEPNTAANIETCGFLAGKISQGKLVITHLVIPRQSGTPDSCTTENEEDFLMFLDEHDLITLGWIHTHPSQTAFLSSVDLHTHMPYQLMLPEAVAIVCAPKFEETGFFVLTPNYGLDYIANCTLTGFHPHPKEPPLFEEGSHIRLNSEANIKVVDLR